VMKKVFDRIMVMQLILMAIIGIGIILFNFNCNEIVVHGNGVGWDGRIYCDMVQNYRKLIFIRGVDAYYIQRILPSSVILVAFKLLNVARTDSNIVVGFVIYNFLLVMISVFFTNLICQELKFKPIYRWFVFVALFVNFPLLKLAYYYPILTDTTAFCLGVVLIYFYLKNRRILLLATLFLGAITWPSFMLMGLPLFIFPIKDFEISKMKYRINIILAVFVSVAMLIFTIFYEYVRPDKGIQLIEKKLLPLSLIVMAVYIIYLFSYIFNNKNIFNVKYIIKSINWVNFIIGSIFYIGFSVFVKLYNLHHLNKATLTMKEVIILTFRRGVRLPGLFIFGEITYFGPIIILMFIFWKEISEEIHKRGIGLLLFISMALVLVINSESRCIVNVLPTIVILVTLAISKLEFKKGKMLFVIFTIFSVFYSKIWLFLNTRNTNSDNGEFLEFPMQKYFMNMGPWISNKMYFVQAIIIVITFIFFIYLYKKYRVRKEE